MLRRPGGVYPEGELADLEFFWDEKWGEEEATVGPKAPPTTTSDSLRDCLLDMGRRELKRMVGGCVGVVPRGWIRWVGITGAG